MGCLIAFRLCCSRVFALAAVLLFFFVSQGWASCSYWGQVSVFCNSGVGSCSKCVSIGGYKGSGSVSGIGDGCSLEGTVTLSCDGSGGFFHVDSARYSRECAGIDYSARGYFYVTVCTTQCEADSLKGCPSGTHWDSAECTCKPDPVSSSSQDESSSSQAKSSSSSEPESSSSVECQTRFCCDSLAQNRPVELDTMWEGCVPQDPTQPGCIVYNESVTPGDTTLAAECNGLSQYMVCTKEWTWSESAKQCKQLESYNCARFTQSDSNCTGIICYLTQRHSLSSLDYNNLTLCYTGTETIENILICSNGNVVPRDEYKRSWQVCKPYLDSLGTNIGDYVSGRSGYSGAGMGFGGGTGGGSGGGSGSGGSGSGSGSGGTGGGTGGGCVGNGCGGTGGPYGGNGNGMADGFGGGESLDGQGNTVTNSASPGIGGTWSPIPQVVTEVDSNGNVQIIKNSQGGDSIKVVDTWTQVKCLGVSNGVATMTNGKHTWTCEAMSCSQANISASINNGMCSATYNGIQPSDPNPSTPVINYDDGTSSVDVMFGNYEAIYGPVVSTLNSNHYDDKRHLDSLALVRDRYWKITFGNDLSYIDSIRSKVEQNVSATQGVASAVGSSTEAITSAVGGAANTVSGTVSAGLSDVRTSVNNVRNAVNHLDTTVKNFKDTYVVKANDINGSIVDVGSQVQQTRTTLRDTVHNTNQILENINSVIADTGRTVTETVKDIDRNMSFIPASIWSIDSNISSLAIKVDSFTKENLISWSNDKLVMIIDTNVQKVADAIDSLKLDVKLDSVSVIVEHDTTLDSIRSDLKAKGNFSLQQNPDTVNFGKIFQQGFDSVKGDTSFTVDSSLSKLINSAFYVEGSDFSDNTNVDSLTSEINRKLDSSNVVHNARSDSLTGAYVDTMMKYSGLKTGAPAVQQFFAQGGNDACPRNCLDLSLTNPFGNHGKPTKIQFSTYLCDMKIFANYSVLDFIKLILRLMTSLLCLMFIWSTVGKRGDNK